MAMQLVLAPSPGFRAWTLEQAGDYVNGLSPSQKPSLWTTNTLASALETIRIQLEGDARGSRYPLVARLGDAMAFEPITGWDAAELPSLLEELKGIQSELEHLGLDKQAVVHFGDEGYPEVYSRESRRLPELEARLMGDKAAKNLWEKNRPILEIVTAMALAALDRDMGIMIW